MYRQAAEFSLSKTSTRWRSGEARDDWWMLYLPALLVTVCVAWWECLPIYIGYAFSMFALAAVVIVARLDVSSIAEKRVWGAIALVLLGAEAGVAYRTHLRAQSFLVCRFSEEGVGTIELHGNKTLRSASMQVIDEHDLKWLKATLPDNGEVWFRAYQHVPLGLFAPGGSKAFAVKRPAVHQGGARYRVQFSAEDDYWWEDYQAVSQHGVPVQALRIMRYAHGRPTMVYQDADQDYPRDPQGRVDWAWAAKEP